MRAAIFHKPLWLVLASVLCAAGMWIYARRVLVPYQMHDASAHERPRGNLSDLYPSWLGARELLLHGRDPYSLEVTREIQIGFYGRALDPSRPEDPRDEERFVHPVYVVFYLAPTIGLPFAVVQKGFYWVLLLVTCGTTLLWIGILRCHASLWAQISALAWTMGLPAVMQGLNLRQISLLVSGLIAIAIVLLVSDHLAAAGVVLALATIKPQIVLLLLCGLALWIIGDWRNRYRLAVSFLGTMVVLIAASEWYLPHWILRFRLTLHEYVRYTGAAPLIGKLVGAPWSWLLEFLALAATLVVCWRERRQPANSNVFAFTFSLVLATTVLLVPTPTNYNQVFLIPSLLVVAKELRTIWRKSVVNRVFLVLTISLIFWPWISSIALAALSFFLPPETVERGWAIPFWTAIQIPIAVTALMLVLYYQGTFATSLGPRSS